MVLIREDLEGPEGRYGRPLVIDGSPSEHLPVMDLSPKGGVSPPFPFRDYVKMTENGNHFLTVVEGHEHPRAIGERVLWHGAQEIRFEG